MQTLAVALERKQWELAALCLLLGLTEAAAKLPPEAIEGLLEVLAADGASARRKRRSRRDRAH
jgi:hypothetical protein